MAIKKIFCGLMVLLMAVTFAGCGENSPRQRVTQTVTAALTAPNEVLLAVLSDPSASEEDVVSAMREVFGKWVAEDSLIGSKLFQIVLTTQVSALAKGVAIEVNSVEVTQSQDNSTQYGYRADATLTLADGTSNDVGFNGTVQLNEDGKVDFMSAVGSGMDLLGRV